MHKNKWKLLGHIVFRQKSRNESKILSLLFPSIHFMFGFSNGLFQSRNSYTYLLTDIFIFSYPSKGELKGNSKVFWESNTIKWI